MNLSAFHESLTKLLAHEELAVEMVMLNCNKRKQKYKVSKIKDKLYGCHSYVLRSLFPPHITYFLNLWHYYKIASYIRII